MEKSKLNCWEFKKCGREKGGSSAAELGVCPASTETALFGVHDGKYAGRACWAVAGTMCKGDIQGTFAQKYRECSKCDFYNMVKTEEWDKFVPTIVLTTMLE